MRIRAQTPRMKTALPVVLAGCLVLAACNRPEEPATRADTPPESAVRLDGTGTTTGAGSGTAPDSAATPDSNVDEGASRTGGGR